MKGLLSSSSSFVCIYGPCDLEKLFSPCTIANQLIISSSSAGADPQIVRARHCDQMKENVHGQPEEDLPEKGKIISVSFR